MKKLFYFLICIVFISCGKEELKEPTFLIGYWNRQNDKANQNTFEIWNKDLTGIGFTLANNDTVFKEVLSIVKMKDSLFLKVEGVNEKPTLFKFIQQTDTSFTCENLQNEFPKKIKYYIESNTLNAKVSNEEFSIDFVFLKSL